MYSNTVKEREIWEALTMMRALSCKHVSMAEQKHTGDHAISATV